MSGKTPVPPEESETVTMARFELRLRRAEFGAYWATMISAGLALCAVFGAVWQIREAHRIQMEATAYQTYDAYLRLGLEHPKLGCVNTQEALADVLADPILAEQYSFYLGIVLSASEQILEARPNETYWKRAVGVNFDCHAPALMGSFRESQDYLSFSCALRKELAAHFDAPDMACPP
jgi:hypothetical protein